MLFLKYICDSTLLSVHFSELKITRDNEIICYRAYLIVTNF